MTEHSIFSDNDVRQIYFVQNGQPILHGEGLDEGGDTLLANLFVEKDSIVDESAGPAVLVDAILAGISAVDRFSSTVPIGWKKLIVFRVGEVTRGLWELQRDPRVGNYADWVVATMGRNGWRPDGYATALGEQYSYCLRTAAHAGGGILLDRASDQFRPTSGSRASEEAGGWYVDWAVG